MDRVPVVNLISLKKKVQYKISTPLSPIKSNALGHKRSQSEFEKYKFKNHQFWYAIWL